MIRAKKYLGQHFLKDENIARNIVNSLQARERYDAVLEIGPGMGILTRFLLEEKSFTTWAVDVDEESIEYLKKNFPALGERIIHADFLEMDFSTHFPGSFAVIGNFPYNISSQILFKILEHREQVPEMVGMFQKEVAERIASKPGNKTYGILSVLTQAFYTLEYLFTVNENVFSPPPKVKSAVIRMERNSTKDLGCDEALFFKVVKTAFNQRRKTLRNALKPLLPNIQQSDHPLFPKRAEELSVERFVELTNYVNSRQLGSPEGMPLA